MAILDLAKPNQYGPRGLKGRGCLDCQKNFAGVEVTSDGSRGNGGHGDQRTDEADLSARLQRLGERLGHAEGHRPAETGDRAAANASGYARGFRLSTELVAGVLVGAGLGWLIDRWL